MVREQVFKYKNIAISGGVASGKGTLAQNLYAILKNHGFKHFSGSELAHTYAPQFYQTQSQEGIHTHHDATQYSDEVDRSIDEKITEMLRSETHCIVDSWLAGFNSREMKDVLRVLLICSEPSVIVDRVVNRDHCTVAAAKSHIKERTEKNQQKWKRIYGDFAFYDPALYTVTIDTFSHGPLETAGIVLDTLGYKLSL